ncbi:beta-phosphoglucomutase [Dysgonomonas sp. PFB1-18]|uniref:HAD family hydrolase n=1 Tax=unclassified Dysgonomonas TaxID=2630389 RepID=UPI00247344E5|nr:MULTISPECIES: HAD-IA family hydrolase [unclassified Dysgonomonas]MDH6309691.1 beta-phosphoglucomutase [Dysgonomonas sp. PF1-14]MDH6339301.1 beta-phosphoglucomutase [Dysgonomonas sp. PF1-16]MDH6380800.1 beta-phosphoglucomutase [Dysgonomonas sp. PFB1-18]MDH6398296.1 beta-phosphoglucomutase [Dysgonomonas sp. PF1-23]
MTTAFSDYLKQHDYKNFDLKAVLFDMDGVLYDSMKWHAKSWKETMDEFNISSTSDEFYLYEGMVGRSTINHLMNRERKRDATPEETDAIYKRKTELFSEYNDGSLIPYAYDFVKQVHDDGFICAIVTGSGQPTLINKIETNFAGLFSKERMVTAFDVKHGKPHPEPYLMGLEKAGRLKPNQAIVIENAPRGVEAAVAAGIFTIAINTGPIPEKILADAGANIVLPSMEALYTNWSEYRKQLIAKAD